MRARLSRSLPAATCSKSGRSCTAVRPPTSPRARPSARLTWAAPPSMDQHAPTTLLPLAVTVLVVFRFAFRELRERTVTSPGVWIRPAIIGVLTVYLVVLTAGIDGRDDGIMLVGLAVGAG